MVTRADLTPRYQGVTSAGPRAPDPMAPPSNTGVYATMHPISKEPELSNVREYNADLMLGQRRRRWNNIKSTFCQYFVLATSCL